MLIKRDGAPAREEPGALMLSDAGEKKLLTQHNSSCLLMQQRHGPRSAQTGVLEGVKIKSAGGCKKKVQVTSSERGSSQCSLPPYSISFYWSDKIKRPF